MTLLVIDLNCRKLSPDDRRIPSRLAELQTQFLV